MAGAFGHRLAFGPHLQRRWPLAGGSGWRSTKGADGCKERWLLRSARRAEASFQLAPACLSLARGNQSSRRRFASDAGPQESKQQAAKPGLLLNTKVSSSGTSEALFDECLEEIRKRRAQESFDAERELAEDTPVVTKLKQDEIELTRKIFRRIDPSRQVTSDNEDMENHIDPYWNPFHKLRNLKEQVTAEFDEYAKLASVAEAKRIRIQIKKSLRKSAEAYNPYTAGFAKYHGRSIGSDEPPKPFRMLDKYWDRTPLQQKLSQERITWRDVDIIQHGMADNGYILPRRTTMLSKSQQKKLVKAIKGAKYMGLVPIHWKPADYQAMPLMDPLQWMVDRLADRVIEAHDKRSRAMLKVMIERHPELNYRRFLKHEAARGPRPEDHYHHVHETSKPL